MTDVSMIVSMRRTRWPVILGVGLVLLAVIGAAVFLMNRSSAAAAPNPGPITWGFPSGVSGWAYPDKPFYFGGAAVINHDPAGRPAILERVALLAPSNGLRIVKAYTTRPNQQTITATDASLPPRAGETLYPFTGAKVPAQPRGTKDPIAYGISLVLSGPATAKTHTFDGIILKYKIGHEQYQVTMYQQARICVTAHADNPTAHCEPPNEHGVPENPPGMGS
jgi:hypothetical protein